MSVDWQALLLSLRLAGWTTVILFVVGLLVARSLAWRRFRGQSLIEAIVALPLVLPPTVLGYYLLLAFGDGTPLGNLFSSLTDTTLVFSFAGLLLGSCIYSVPFAVQPMLRAFEAIPGELREAAWTSGMSNWQTFWRIEFPLAWPGVLTALVLTFAHTLGEFGVVLMVGGNIPGQTRTISIAIYDRVQAFDDTSAGQMALVLLLFSFFTIYLVFAINGRQSRRLA